MKPNRGYLPACFVSKTEPGRAAIVVTVDLRITRGNS